MRRLGDLDQIFSNLGGTFEPLVTRVIGFLGAQEFLNSNKWWLIAA